MQKKSSTKQTEERGDLATMLAAVFAHPDLPDAMWDAISDALCEMDNSFDKYSNPEVMREVLSGYRTRRETKQKGGPRR